MGLRSVVSTHHPQDLILAESAPWTSFEPLECTLSDPAPEKSTGNANGPAMNQY